MLCNFNSITNYLYISNASSSYSLQLIVTFKKLHIRLQVMIFTINNYS
nr:MAG TPA: hypothetical protein [Caudoviricetes sp.]